MANDVLQRDPATGIPTWGAAAAGGGGLVAANNLNDVADAATSRYNVHVPILASAQAVATSNVASLSGAPTLDGVTPAAGDIVLLTAQTTGSQNGPWVTAAGAWTRPADYPTTGTVKGRCIEVNAGTLYGGTLWVLRTTSAVTIDTTSTTWAQANANSYAAKQHASTHAPGGTDDLTTALSTASTPSPIGTPALGSGTGFARGGHVHGMTTDSGSLSTDLAVSATTPTTVLTTGTLAVGTWLFMPTVTIAGATGATCDITAAAGTASATLTGSQSTTTRLTAGFGTAASLAVFANVTVAGTLLLRVYAGVGVTAKATSVLQGYANASGWVAIKIG